MAASSYIKIMKNEKAKETPVTTTKQFRKDLDDVLQRLKQDVTEQRSSRERSHTITKIQEAIMWLGMDLKAQAEEGAEGCENPYPHSYDPKSETIDPTADGLKL